MQKKIAVAKGDGVGPEVVNEGVKILQIIDSYTDYQFDFQETPIGGNVWKQSGSNLPEKSFQAMKSADAILFGAVGLPDLSPGVAESGLLRIRQELNLFANIRPIRLYPDLIDLCPLKPTIVEKGINMTIIRENTEGLYSQIGSIVNNETATDVMVYTRSAVSRIIRFALNYASNHNHTKIISVDKANVLACSQFWRKILEEEIQQYPQLSVKHFYVDSFCQWLLRAPSTIETVVSDNMFGDIISDEAVYLLGSLGMGSSANFNPSGVSLYEPIHGAANDIAGQDIANPIGTILSIKLMMEHSFHNSEVGSLIDRAVQQTLRSFRTVDIQTQAQTQIQPYKTTTCSSMGTEIAKNLKNLLKS